MTSDARPRLAILMAATLLMATSGGLTAEARDNHQGRHDRSDRRERDNSDLIWKRHENGCAVGNTPPPGANCTNRDPQK
jgi:hypothetical protein